MSLRGTQGLSNVDEEVYGGFAVVVHSWLKAELREGRRRRPMREDDEGRMMREARAKTGWEHGHIYTASQDPQIDRREVHFGRRAWGTKIGPLKKWGRGGVVRKDGLLWRLKRLERLAGEA
jgi:hypothetical protein